MKIQKKSDNKVLLLPGLYNSDGSNALLYELIINFSAKFYCFAVDEIAPFAGPIPSVRPSVRDRREHCENGER